MSFSVEFFCDEVRDGFLIPAAMKQAWAAELQVLAEIDRICKKYDISYFADWGTLLGVVRHGGFIPWDDDLDICMKRKDYERFLLVSQKEFPEGFCVYDYKTKDNHWLFLSRVVNKNRICFEEDHLRTYHNFPYIAGVDIFVLDNFYADETKEKERCDSVLKLLALAEPVIDGKADKKYRSLVELELLRLYGIKDADRLSDRELCVLIYEKAEELLCKTPDSEAGNMGQIYPFGLKGYRGVDKKYYERSVSVSFLTGTIQVSPLYNRLLSGKYGDYFKVRKVWNGHEYPFFEGQKASLLKVGVDMSAYEYKYEKKERGKCLVSSIKEDGANVIKEVLNLFNDRESAEYLSELARIQELLTEFGTLVEESYGEGSEVASTVVGFIEAFFEAEYELYNCLCDGRDEEAAYKRASYELCKLSDCIKITFDVGEAVYLCTSPSNTEMLGLAYDNEDPDLRRHVIYVPYFFKDPVGELIMEDEDIERCLDVSGFDERFKVQSMFGIDLEKRQPKKIYIFDPYDSYASAISISPQFYASRLRDYTEELIFVQPYAMDDFTSEDIIDMKNLALVAKNPGCYLADKILVGSETLKERFCEVLGLSDEKFQVISASDTASEPGKKLLYCIGLDTYYECGKDFLRIVGERLEQMKKSMDKSLYDAVIYPGAEFWDEEIIKSLRDLFGEILFPDEVKCEDYKAYYGSGSPFVIKFTRNKRPVMLEENRLYIDR